MPRLTMDEMHLIDKGDTVGAVRAVRRRLYPMRNDGLKQALILVEQSLQSGASRFFNPSPFEVEVELDTAAYDLESRIAEVYDVAKRLGSVVESIEALKKVRAEYGPGDWELAEAVDQLLSRYQKVMETT